MARIAFLQNVFEDQLGILWISAFVKERGHECEVFIVSSRRALSKEMMKYKPDIVGFPFTTGNTSFVLSTAREIRAFSKALIVLGGPHPTHLPEIIHDEAVDIVCRGEGEHAMAELADAIDGNRDFGHIENLWVKTEGGVYKNELRPLIADLDSLPFPDRSYHERYPLLRNKATKFFICSRGCPFNCSFCSNPALKKLYRSKGRFVRFRSPANVVGEITQIQATGRLSYCQFVDELMISDREWLFDFLELYRKEVGLPFSFSIQAHIVDEEIIRAMVASGCNYVNFGVETGNETLRTTVLNKQVTNEEIIRTASLLKKYGLKFKTYNMFGIPKETVDNALETLRLNRQIKPEYMFASLVQFFPGTKLTHYALKEGMIDKDYASKAPTIYFKSSICSMSHIKEIARLQKLLVALVKLPVPESLIRFMIKLPLDPLYGMIFIVSYGILVWRSTQRRLISTLIIGWRSLRLLRSH